ncbi:hypothetical protein [Kribbella sp. NPDC048915]|uniref:hypothetical protein n=1 Tax=Kribbella sp. NPDC048915 TaxID=3155148 RepID=UPI0033F5A0E9
MAGMELSGIAVPPTSSNVARRIRVASDAFTGNGSSCSGVVATGSGAVRSAFHSRKAPHDPQNVSLSAF